jgi:hypothetical protein
VQRFYLYKQVAKDRSSRTYIIVKLPSKSETITASTTAEEDYNFEESEKVVATAGQYRYIVSTDQVFNILSLTII